MSGQSDETHIKFPRMLVDNVLYEFLVRLFFIAVEYE